MDYIDTHDTIYGKTFEGKTLRLSTKHTIHWKTFAVHQAQAIMYCTQQMIQRENFRDWLKKRKSFPPRKFCHIRYHLCIHTCNIIIRACILTLVPFIPGNPMVPLIPGSPGNPGGPVSPRSP